MPRKEKLPKFLIAENPMASTRSFIYHSRRPRFIAEILEDLDGADIEVIDWIDEPAGNPDRITGLMKRMGDWYAAYCAWEGGQITDDIESSLKKFDGDENQ